MIRKILFWCSTKWMWGASQEAALIAQTTWRINGGNVKMGSNLEIKTQQSILLTEFIEELYTLNTHHVLWATLPALTWSLCHPRDKIISLNQIVPRSLFCIENSDSSTKIRKPPQTIFRFVGSLRNIGKQYLMVHNDSASPHHANHLIQLLYVT